MQTLFFPWVPGAAGFPASEDVSLCFLSTLQPCWLSPHWHDMLCSLWLQGICTWWFLCPESINQSINLSLSSSFSFIYSRKIIEHTLYTRESDLRVIKDKESACYVETVWYLPPVWPLASYSNSLLNPFYHNFTYFLWSRIKWAYSKAYINSQHRKGYMNVCNNNYCSWSLLTYRVSG